MAIKNIVFDLGNVLIRFDPVGYMRDLGFDEPTIDRLQKAVFGAPWRRYDRGDYPSITDMADKLVPQYPALEAPLRLMLRPDWVRIHTLIEDTAAYLHELKARGYRIYLLSNLAKESYDFVKNYAFFRDLDGGVFSYRERVIKPDERIYRILLERYALVGEETVFLDDSAENIAAAARCGIRGVVFTDPAAAKAQLELLLRQNQSPEGKGNPE